MTTTLIVIFICSFLAFTISAICGGGAGLMLIPFLGRVLPIAQVPAALSIGTFASSATRLLAFRKNVRWQIVRYFVPAAVPAVWLGAYLLKFLNPLYLELLIGLFLISNLPALFKKQKAPKEMDRPKTYLLVVVGFFAGFLSGLTGAVGLLFNKFYLRYGLSKEEILATRAANEISLHLIKLVLYGVFGLLSGKVFAIGLVVALAALLSTWTIKYLLPRISEFMFRKIGYLAMVASGFLMLSQSTKNLLVSHEGSLVIHSISKGLETKLQWQQANFALEFTYDEGFEFEQVIPLDELTKERKERVIQHEPGADKIIVEVVYSINDTSYEAYYFKDKRFIGKYDFE